MLLYYFVLCMLYRWNFGQFSFLALGSKGFYIQITENSPALRTQGLASGPVLIQQPAIYSPDNFLL